MKYLHIVWRNLLRRKIRTIFTLLSIFVAFVLFGYPDGGAQRVQHGHRPRGRRPADGAQQDLAHHAGAVQLQARRSRRSRASRTSRYANWFGGYYQETKNQFAEHGGRRRELAPRCIPSSRCRRDQKKAWLADRQGAIVGTDTGEAFRLEGRRPRAAAGDDLPAPGRPRVGVQHLGHLRLAGEGHRQDAAVLPLDAYLNEVAPHDARSATRSAGTWSRSTIRSSRRRSRRRSTRCSPTRRPKRRPTAKRTSSPGWAKQIGNISLITQLIAAAAIFMMLLVTANTMAQSIRERTSELAVLKTLGFGDGRVLSMVLMESCVLALRRRARRPRRVVDARHRGRRSDRRVPAAVLLPGQGRHHRRADGGPAAGHSPPAPCRRCRRSGSASSTR